MITLMIEKGDRVVYHTSYRTEAEEKKFIRENGLFLPENRYATVSEDIFLLEENLAKIHKDHKKLTGIFECDTAYLTHTFDDGREECYRCDELENSEGTWYKV